MPESTASGSEIRSTSVVSNPPSTSESRGTPIHSDVTRTLPGLGEEIVTRYQTEGAVPQPVGARREGATKAKSGGSGMAGARDSTRGIGGATDPRRTSF